MTYPSHRIVEDLRADILAGKRAPGERLPSNHELAELYGTSRPTVRRAIERLKVEGLVVTSQGRATLVRSKAPVDWLTILSKYARHVGEEEGITFLRSYPCRDDWLTPGERAAVQEHLNENTGELLPPT